MPEFVTVNCSVPNGVKLHLSERAEGEFGQSRFVQVGPHVELRPGPNSVDAIFWDHWLEQNSGSDLLINNLVQGPKKEKK